MLFNLELDRTHTTAIDFCRDWPHLRANMTVAKHVKPVTDVVLFEPLTGGRKINRHFRADETTVEKCFWDKI